MRQNTTIHSIQLLRSIAATLVVLFHAQQAFGVRVSAPFFANETYLFGFGAVGVHIFFVISGFIMVLTSSRPDRPFEPRKFFRRRLMRIYPIYWLCAGLYVGVHFLIGQPYMLSVRESIGALLLWPSDASLLIGPAWTLSYEMFFYICFGLALAVSARWGLLLLAAAFLASIVVGRFLPWQNYDLYVVTNPLLIEFLAGTAIGWLAQNGRLPKRWGGGLTIAGALLFAAGIAVGYDRLPSPIMWGVPSAILVLGLVTWERATGAAPWVRGLGRLGDSSYVLYLVHILVITVAVVVCQATVVAPEPALAAAIIAVCSIAVAEVLHRGVEKPMLSLLSPGRSLLPSRNQHASGTGHG